MTIGTKTANIVAITSLVSVTLLTPSLPLSRPSRKTFHPIHQGYYILDSLSQFISSKRLKTHPQMFSISPIVVSSLTRALTGLADHNDLSEVSDLSNTITGLAETIQETI